MSNRRIPVTPVPWQHKTSSLAASWNWETPHFSVTIFAEGMNTKPLYNWKILDKSSGFPKPFDNGTDISFQNANDTILEIIGKSYPRTLGYQAYAGPLASTFLISDGKKYDFSPAIGENVLIQFFDESNRPVNLTGQFDIQNYDFTITNGDQVLLIPPQQVIDVLAEFGRHSLIKNVTGPGRSSSGRIVYEEWTRGCTGKPGFRPGTTQHPPGTPYCPIHNI